MNPTPTGRVVRTDAGRDLVLVRTFTAPIEDVWASLTEPDRTARWFGRWHGTARVGETVTYTMGFEEGGPEARMTIERCDPPHVLVVRGADEYQWHLEAQLSERDGITELRFLHHLTPDIDVASVGPGWEYYLDNLVASRDDTPLPSFDDYYPAQAAYFTDQDVAGPAERAQR